MSDTSSPQRKWLEENRQSLEWRLVGPNLKNQYDLTVSDEKLEEYIENSSALTGICKVHACMGDTPVLMIIDLESLQFETDHPYINGLEIDELREHLEETGIWDQINDDFKAFREECRKELEERRSRESGGGSKW